jgi:hypothetical protein
VADPIGMPKSFRRHGADLPGRSHAVRDPREFSGKKFGDERRRGETMKKNDLCPKIAGETYGQESRFSKRKINRHQNFFYHNGPKRFMIISSFVQQ